MHAEISRQFQELVAAARRVASDVGEAVESALRAGLESPLPPEEARALLTRMVAVIRERAAARGDSATAATLEADVEALIQRALETRASLDRETDGGRPSLLEPHDGVKPEAVRPTPIFHMRPVPVRQGFVRIRDIKLWDENARLEIHLAQFRENHGRAPTSTELLDIMMGKLQLPGLGEVEDQFEIRELARSIAINGVRKPPILDVDGTLLDGNRRVTACRLILDSSEFGTEAKARAEWVVAWELTEHATEADRDAVVVSLNFEPDNKQDWPKYVKARKVYAEWEALLALEPRPNPPAVRQAELRRQLAQKFALATNEVSKFIDMVRTAEEFEDYQTEDRKRDHYEVKHRAAEAFEYFDELSKGKSAGGVQHTLNQDEPLKHLVFDLLFDSKFKRWDQIRDLKHIAGSEEARDMLRRARAAADRDEAQELVTDACALVKVARREQRTLGANQRIEAFCKWFDDLPVVAFREGETGAVSRGNLGRLHAVLKNVEAHLTAAAAGGCDAS